MSDDCAIVAAFAPSLGINTALPNDCCTANKAPRVMCFQNRVIQLNVSEAGLQGYITPAITGLAALTSIDLTNNPSLSGSIPSQISRMPALREFYIANTGITGQIPQMPLPPSFPATTLTRPSCTARSPTRPTLPT
ncbi:hypothetical protein BC828DRAFT_153663 [Blastocladiella britannica]|nr:hypothetical protein BC828DRAFT_153663 [Blastocladiella britannica]